MAEQFVGPDITGDTKPDADITNALDFTVIGGVIFEDAARVGSGTGNYNTFLAISNNSGVEAGFNSDDTPPIDSTNSDIDQAKTHTVLLSSLVQITVNGVQYYQVRIDLNEANSDPNAQISLDQFKIYTSTNGGLESTTQLFNPANATLKYNMDAGQDISILLSDAGSTGSGTDDYAILIPVSTFAGLDPTTTYFYVYTQMGAADGADWNAGATFEEFNLENGVALTGVKFSDLDNDGVRDAGEPGVAGVTIFIDSNHNGILDAGERSTVTDVNGNYTFYGVALNQTVWIDEVVPAGATQTTGDHEEVTIPLNNPPPLTTVDPIGNHYLTPHVSITKAGVLHDGGDCVDDADDVVDYTVTVTNDGELALTGVVVKDSFEGGSDVIISGPASGDTNSNGILDVGETWTYTYSHDATQADIDSNGGDDDGTLDNVATVNASSSNGSVSASDDASVEVCPAPSISIDKTAVLHDGGDCVDDADDVVDYTVTVTNTGNVTLDNVVVTDSFEGGGGVTITGPDSGDTNSNGLLDVGETWTYTYSHDATQADIDSNGGDGDGTLDNVATVNADTDANGSVSASDDASVDVCPAPAISIDKTAVLHDGGDCVDDADDVVDYTVTVTNTGNVTLDNVVVTDSFEGGGGVTITGPDSGDTNSNGLLDVGETWTYTYSHDATQADIDSNGGDGDGTLDNVATVNADTDANGSVSASDDASVDVCPAPAISIDKTAVLHDGGDCVDDADDVVDYTVTVTNTGNVTLDNVVVTDSFEGGGGVTITGPDSGDTNSNGLLDVGETWTYTYSHDATQADIDSNGGDGDGTLDNVATVNADTDANGSVSASDDASVDVCPAPAISIDKTAVLHDGGDCVDDADDVVDYTVTVTNTGNVTLDNVVVTDSFEGGGGVTITGPDSGDTNSNGLLDVGETWTYTYSHDATQADIDSNGGDGDGTLDNVATVNADTDANGSVSASDDASVDVCPAPAISIDKTAVLHDGGDCVDDADDVVDYTVTVTNTGNVTLDNVVVTDSFEGGGGVTITGPDSGDTNSNGLLDVGETWTYTYSHDATQADIDSNGGDGDGTLDNVATVNADTDANGSVSASDDASVDVCPAPGVDLTKYVDVGFGYDDANTGPGPENVNVGGDVNFKITVENTGNVTLTDVDINDTYLSGGAPGTTNLLVDNGALTAYALAHNAVLTGDDGNGLLDVGETWEITYTEAFDPLSFQPGAHLNTADVSDAQGVSDEDSAYYFSLVDTGLCPRTPGFWQNNNNGGQFWDGVQGNEKHAGEDGFPTGELLYAVDSNHDGVINGSDQKGLLIGDYNKDGLTDNGEDTLFVSYADARSLINSSNKQLNGLSGDGKFILGRDMVASWLNYLQGSGFGDASDPNSPHHYLDDGIDWMQIYSGTTAGGLNESFDQLKLTGSIIKTSSATWNTPVSGIDHSAQQVHNALDYYNNTGQTQVGGVHYANCCDCAGIFQALSIYQDAHDLV